MAFFIGIACPWILVAVFLLMSQRRAEDPTAGQWRSEPSAFFGGPIENDPPSSSASSSSASQTPPPAKDQPAAAAGTVH